jgi:hypothetical protein
MTKQVYEIGKTPARAEIHHAMMTGIVVPVVFFIASVHSIAQTLGDYVGGQRRGAWLALQALTDEQAKGAVMTSPTAILKAVRQQDVPVLNNLIERDLSTLPPLTPSRVQQIWEACWTTWSEQRQAPLKASSQPRHVTLGAFMSCWRAAYPWLPSQPAWAAVGDPENE